MKMMKIMLCLLLLLFSLCNHLVLSVQPYFPPQIVFSFSDGYMQTTYAIDEINQRASRSFNYSSTGQETSYLFKHIPYAIPDSPQSKYYVQLLVDSSPADCVYGTYWAHGGSTFNSFPYNWFNGSSTEIKNYPEFFRVMIHSNDSSVDEDYWYSNTTCELDSGEIYPCEEIYFRKNTDIPLRTTQVVRRQWVLVREVTNYIIISIGKPDEKYFDSIPKNWSLICRDDNLELLYYPQTTKVDLNQSVKVQVWLYTPPHRINGNDTVTIQWKVSSCSDCFTWAPKQFSFNRQTFDERQTLTITRVKDGPVTEFHPIFYGGGFDLVSPTRYPIIVE